MRPRAPRPGVAEYSSRNTKQAELTSLGSDAGLSSESYAPFDSQPREAVAREAEYAEWGGPASWSQLAPNIEGYSAPPAPPGFSEGSGRAS